MRGLLVGALFACCACGRAGEEAAAPAFATGPVCKTQLARAEGGLPKRETPSAAQDLEERVRGLVLDRASARGRMRELALEDIVALGVAAVPVLAGILSEESRSSEEQLSVLETLGAIDAPASAEALAAVVNPETVRVPWMRAQAAFQLSKQSSDVALAFLLSQLKYETDGETVIWIAAYLARHANFAGVDGLRVLSSTSSDPQVRADARAMLAQLVADAHCSDDEQLWRLWNSPDLERRLPREEPSPELRLEVWRRIAALAEFDLRLVDDARFALSHGAAWVVEPLSLALHDEQPHVRVHVTQCLERMGPRGQAACGELLLALDEGQMASSAAAALASVGCDQAVDALVLRTRAGNGPEMRAAASAALGRLATPRALPALRVLLSRDEPLDLRQVAAQSLLELGEEREATLVLLECLTAAGADCGAAEEALESWLVRRAGEGEQAQRELLDAWRALAGAEGETPTAAQSAQRRERRADMLSTSGLGADAQPDSQ